MATVTMMRCTTAHWQGMDFIAAGKDFPAGDPRVIAEFFTVYTVETDTPAPEKRKPGRPAGSKNKPKTEEARDGDAEDA